MRVFLEFTTIEATALFDRWKAGRDPARKGREGRHPRRGKTL
jgi:hypothetical protein